MSKKEIILILLFLGIVILKLFNVPYSFVILLLSVSISSLLVVIWELLKKENSIGKRIFSAYYKSFFYITSFFIIEKYHGKDLLSFVFTLLFISFLFWTIFNSKEKTWKNILTMYLYFMLLGILYFI